MDQERIDEYLTIAAELRNHGINTELYSEPHKFSRQMRYANRKGIKVVIIAGEEEFSLNTLTLRQLVSGEQISISRDDLVGSFQQLLINM